MEKPTDHSTILNSLTKMPVPESDHKSIRCGELNFVFNEDGSLVVMHTSNGTIFGKAKENRWA
jgi:hypothetical protein